MTQQTRVCRLHDKHDIRVDIEDVRQPGPGEVMVGIEAGGICGSDLHYYHDGGFGSIRVREPIILGHEIAGTVQSVGPDVTIVATGDRVALNPSQPCETCRYCAQGLQQHCLEMRFYGSAMRFPHEQGAFRDRIIARDIQCVRVDGDRTIAEVACSEPLAVCLHARNQAGDLAGRRVLVTGAGPIGALCTAIAHHAGASEIIVTDLQDAALDIASRMGATRTINIANEPGAMDGFAEDKGYFDVAFECSAAQAAIKSAIAGVRPRATIVQVGITGSVALPLNVLVAKEISLKGTHRFHAEFEEAVHLIDSGAIDVGPIITDTYPLEEAAEAFLVAGDRSRVVKVQLSFA